MLFFSHWEYGRSSALCMSYSGVWYTYSTMLKILEKLIPQKKGAGDKEKPDKKAPLSPEDTETLRQYQEGVVHIQDILVPAGVGVNAKYLEIDGKFAATLFVLSYPRYLETNWLSPIINFDVEFDAAMYTYPQDSAAILRQLKRRITQVSASMIMRAEGGKVRDPQLETAYRDIEELRDRLIQGTERFFKSSLYLTVYGDTKDELDEIVAQLEVLLEGRLVYAKPALFQTKEGFLTTLPLGQDKLVRLTNMSSSSLSTFFPFVSSDLTSNNGILYGINLHNNSLILFDRFSLANANLTMFAKSGAGKSIKGSEPVLVRQDGRVRLCPIQEVVDELIAAHGITYTDDELEGVAFPDIEAFSFNKDLQGEWSRVTVAARKDAPQTFYTFTTKSGREITTTGDHNMLVLRDGSVQVVKSTEVKAGEYVPLPRAVVMNKETSPRTINLLTRLTQCPQGIYVLGAQNLIDAHYENLKTAVIDTKLDRYLYKYRQGTAIPLQYFLKLLDRLGISPDNLPTGLRVCSKNGNAERSITIELSLTPGFFRLFGYIVAEGTIGKDFIILSNTDPELLRDAGDTLQELGVPFYYTDRSLHIASRVFVNLLWAIGCKGKSAHKHVPSLVFESSSGFQAAFLQGYFEGDGGVERSSLSAVSKSKALIGEISYLLYSFGIVGRIAQTRKEAVGQHWKEKKVYWKCTISGQENLQQFAVSIGFTSQRKQEALECIVGTEANTNVDLIPEVSQIFEELSRLFGFQLHGIHEISAWKRAVRSPSPRSLQRVVAQIEDRVHRFKDLAGSLHVLGELPVLDDVIAQGRGDRNLNRTLWQELVQSWRVVKTRGVEPRCQNAFKMISVVNGVAYEPATVKQAVYQGLREVGLQTKYQSGSLQNALIAQPRSDTTYRTIHSAARAVWDRYWQVRDHMLPRVEELIVRLKQLATSGLFWDEIVSVEEVANTSDPYVYDLTVDNEVFLAGYGGMFIHNSYAAKLEIMRHLMFGTDVIVIDPEQEYRYLADAVGGSYLRIAAASDHRINPFDLPALKEDDEPEGVLRETVSRLTGLISLMAGGLSPEEQSVTDRGLWEAYALRDVTPTARWDNPQVPTLEDFYTIVSDMEGGKGVALRIERYVSGTFAGVFNRPTNIDLAKQLIVFNVRDMEEELRPIAMYVVLGFIWNMVRSELKRRLLVVDEAWLMMQHEESARFMFSMAKRARKYYLGVTTITQDIQDFLQSPYGKPIVTNSSLQLLLRQSPASIDLLAETFYLTDHEKFRLLESDVGEGIFFAGLKHVAIKIVASYAEDQIITSDPQQVLAIEAAKRELESAGSS